MPRNVIEDILRSDVISALSQYNVSTGLFCHTHTSELNNKIKNKRYHTVSTDKRYHTVSTDKQYHTVSTDNIYHTIRTDKDITPSAQTKDITPSEQAQNSIGKT